LCTDATPDAAELASVTSADALRSFLRPVHTDTETSTSIADDPMLGADTSDFTELRKIWSCVVISSCVISFSFFTHLRKLCGCSVPKFSRILAIMYSTTGSFLCQYVVNSYYKYLFMGFYGFWWVVL
jgi:hypothetical protein